MFNNKNLTALLAEIETAAKHTTEHGTWFEYVSDYALRYETTYGPEIKKIERFETWVARERPELPASQKVDNGVDRVVTTHSGETWAVQNKGHAAGRESSLSDFTNFVEQANGIVRATKLIWVTSGAGLNQKSADFNIAAGRGVIVHNRSWLAAGINYPATLAELRVALEDGKAVAADEPYALRIHQEIAVTKIVASLAAGNPAVQFISACGTGKTVTTHGVHSVLGSQLTAFFVPTLGLMRQTIAAWRRQAAGNITVIAVCSDDSMLAEASGDHLVMSEQEFGDRIIREPEELAAALTASTPNRPTVVFSTYHSAHILVEAQHEFGAPVYELAVADEAHYLAGKGEFGELVKVKDDGRNRLRAQKRVYTTATPKIAEEKHRAGYGIDSMHDGSPVFGPYAHVLTFGEAIQLGILSDYKLSIVIVPDEILAQIEDGTDVDGVSARYLAAAYAVSRAVEDGDTKFISYHSRVKDAKAFAKLVAAEKIAGLTDTIWGSLNAVERETAIKKFEAETAPALLTNVRCLNEGVDIPALDTVIFIDPKSQVSDIIQSIGRVLRLHPGKKRGHIIVPIPMSSADFAAGASVEDVSELMRRDKRWATAFNVVAAIGEHDKTVQQNIEVLVRTGVTGGRNIAGDRETDRIIIDFADDHSVTGHQLKEKLAAGLTLAVHREVAGTWAEKYGKLSVWLDAHGQRFPTGGAAADTEEKAHASWVGTQVKAKRDGELSDERLGYLGALEGWWLRAASTNEVLERDLSDYVDWTVDNGRVPEAGGESASEQYLGGRRAALATFFAKYGGDLNEVSAGRIPRE